MTLVPSWLSALIIAGFAGWIAMRVAQGDTASRWGVGFGTDAPLLFSVVSPDLPTLRAVIEAVIASG